MHPAVFHIDTQDSGVPPLPRPRSSIHYAFPRYVGQVILPHMPRPLSAACRTHRRFEAYGSLPVDRRGVSTHLEYFTCMFTTLLLALFPCCRELGPCSRLLRVRTLRESTECCEIAARNKEQVVPEFHRPAPTKSIEFSGKNVALETRSPV